MINILLVDDHAMIRQGLQHALRVAFPGAHFGEAKDAGEVMVQLRKQAWDVMILDIGLPGRDGLETLKDIKISRPKLPVLMLSMYPEEQFATRVLKAGAAGYLTKEAPSDVLVDAVQRVLRGEKYISPTLAQRLALDLQEGRTDQPLHEKLSDREYQVMCRLGSGVTVSEIAAELGLSVKTISTYRSHILNKMSFKTNAEIMRYAMKNALVN